MARYQMKPDEMQILKSACIKLDDETQFVITYQYHTEEMTLPDGNKKLDRSKSKYRYLGRVAKTADLEKAIHDLKLDAVRLDPWKWPNDPTWNGNIRYTDENNIGCAKWLKSKLGKSMTWENGLKLFDGFDFAKFKKTGEENYNVKAAYPKTGWKTDDGTEVSITDKDALLKLVNKNVWLVQNNTTTKPAA